MARKPPRRAQVARVMANFWFPEGLSQIGAHTVDWVTDTIKARLVASVAASTITVMTGVTGIGADQTLSSRSIVKDDTLACVKYVAGNPTFSSLAAGPTVVPAACWSAAARWQTSLAWPWPVMSRQASMSARRECRPRRKS